MLFDKTLQATDIRQTCNNIAPLKQYITIDKGIRLH